MKNFALVWLIFILVINLISFGIIIAKLGDTKGTYKVGDLFLTFFIIIMNAISIYSLS